MLDALAALHCEIVREDIRFPFDLWLLVRDVLDSKSIDCLETQWPRNFG